MDTVPVSGPGSPPSLTIVQNQKAACKQLFKTDLKKLPMSDINGTHKRNPPPVYARGGLVVRRKTEVYSFLFLVLNITTAVPHAMLIARRIVPMTGA